MSLRLSLRRYRLRLATPLATARGAIAAREGFLVCASAGAREGFGEVAPLPELGSETLEVAQTALEAAARCLPPAPPETPEAIDQALDGIAALTSAPAARAGLELALLDLAAQRAGVPLFRFLDPAASGAAEVSALLSGGDAAALAEAARAAVAEGFRTVKLKVAGRPLAEDLARAAAVRAAIGPAVRLRLDANGGWSEAEAAVALAALAGCAPELCEQPIGVADPAAWRRLRRHGVPLAADESLAAPAARAALLAPPAAVDALALKPPLLGGLLPARRLAAQARALGIDCFVTTSLEGAVGRAGAAHLAATLAGPHAHGLATGGLLAGDLAGEAAPLEGGRMRLGGRPGLGVVPGEAPGWHCPIAWWAARTPRAPALIHGSGSLDYASLDERVRALEHGLEARGVGAGDSVAFAGEAEPDVAALLFAAARRGATLALLDARLTPGELGPLVARCGARLLLVGETLRGRLPGAVALAALAAPPGPPRPARIDPLRASTLLFTSGTSGAPKAAELRFSAHLASARAARVLLGLDASTRFLCCLPLFHVGGLAILIRCALVGGAAVLHARFDAAAAARALDAGATHASLVATTLARTLEARGATAPPPALRAVLIGGGPVPAPLLARARAAGIPVLQTYGLTESASLATCERPGEEDGLTAGPALPGTEVRVVDDSRRPLPPGAEGAIELRGPTLLRGYRGDSGASAAALDGGWLRTGDLGLLDSRGRLRVLSRRTDLIVSGGENVYPAEVEAALLDHPAVAEAAVTARPDPEWGEAVVALVVAGAPVDPEALRSFCRARLAPFKVPREVRLVAALPRTAAGKIDRAALRALLAT